MNTTILVCAIVALLQVDDLTTIPMDDLARLEQQFSARVDVIASAVESAEEAVAAANEALAIAERNARRTRNRYEGILDVLEVRGRAAHGDWWFKAGGRWYRVNRHAHGTQGNRHELHLHEGQIRVESIESRVRP